MEAHFAVADEVDEVAEPVGVDKGLEVFLPVNSTGFDVDFIGVAFALFVEFFEFLAVRHEFFFHIIGHFVDEFNVTEIGSRWCVWF